MATIEELMSQIEAMRADIPKKAAVVSGFESLLVQEASSANGVLIDLGDALDDALKTTRYLAEFLGLPVIR